MGALARSVKKATESVDRAFDAEIKSLLRDSDAVALLRAGKPPVALPVDPELQPLTKEQATTDTLRALQTCFPDRWERVWAGLGMESAADRAARELAKAAAGNPRSAAGALLGAIVGGLIGKLPP